MTSFLKKIATFVSAAFDFLRCHKIITASVAVILAACITLSAIIITKTNKNKPENVVSNNSSQVMTSSEVDSNLTESQPSELESTEETSSVDSESKVSSVTSSKNNSSAKKPSSSSSKKPSTTTSQKPATSTSSTYKYNSNTDINDNVFLDSLVYTGYNLKKHIADGNMWKYILASQKRGLGYLSNIGYAGGSTGYETKNGKPDIKAFERKGLVCASFVTYVYFNYLPNVAGIDTSSLPKPNKSYSANDWYIAGKSWVKKGYSEKIPFKASKTSSGYINFTPLKEIPIGSLMFCCDAKNRSDYCSHVSIYAGYKNGYNWVYHVGNDNGPEFCAMERMHFGPDPQWPIAVISTPKNIRMEAALEITLKDDSAKPIKGVSFTLKNLETGKKIPLGKTNSKGVIIKENLPYGKYTLTQSSVAGYTIKNLSQTINLTTKNNSYNKVSITNIKVKPVESSASEKSDSSENSSGSSASENSSSDNGESSIKKNSSQETSN